MVLVEIAIVLKVHLQKKKQSEIHNQKSSNQVVAIIVHMFI